MDISADMYLFAEGYHDGRMAREYNPDPDGKYYMAGYDAGTDDRSEADERGE
jgi:hypothetical protein